MIVHLTSSSLLLTLVVGGLAPAQTGVWTQRFPATSPGPGTSGPMAFDAARGVTVLYDSTLPETWEYDGATWTRTFPQGEPRRLSGSGMVYDTARRVCVWIVDASPMEVWEYDGVQWAQRGSGGPPRRGSFGLAHDSARNVVVLFGGRRSSLLFSDTWEWDGATWRQRSSGGPRERFRHGMAFDSLRGESVVFGGEGTRFRLGDTWEWDGSRWFEHFGVPGPQPRLTQMVYDSNRGRVVLYGGTDLQSSNFHDTWEWDGQAWTQLQTSGVPTTTGGEMAFDSARGRVVLFLTHNMTGTLQNETWELSFTRQFQPSYTPFGTGCAGNLGVPMLAPAAGQLPRIGQNFRLRLTNIPSTVFNLPFGVLGFSNTRWGAFSLPLGLSAFGMPGCQAFVSVDLSETLVNLGGSADWDIPVPNDPAFLNFDFYAQGAVIDPGANAAGIVVSDAGHGVVGN